MFILIESYTQERGTTLKGSFSTHKEAFEKMCDLVKENAATNISDLITDGEEHDTAVGLSEVVYSVNPYGAYVTNYGITGWDYDIFEI